MVMAPTAGMFVYIRTPKDTEWVQLGGDIDGEADCAYPGISVPLSSDGRRLAIGAMRNDGNVPNSGHVRVYSLTDIDTRVQFGGGDVDGEASADHSGSVVALSSDGRTLAIGAPYDKGNGHKSGHVRVYSHTLMRILRGYSLVEISKEKLIMTRLVFLCHCRLTVEH